MRIAVLKETASGETRVAASLEPVKKFIALIGSVAVEPGARAWPRFPIRISPPLGPKSVQTRSQAQISSRAFKARLAIKISGWANTLACLVADASALFPRNPYNFLSVSWDKEQVRAVLDEEIGNAVRLTQGGKVVNERLLGA